MTSLAPSPIITRAANVSAPAGGALVVIATFRKSFGCLAKVEDVAIDGAAWLAQLSMGTGNGRCRLYNAAQWTAPAKFSSWRCSRLRFETEAGVPVCLLDALTWQTSNALPMKRGDGLPLGSSEIRFAY